MVNSPLTAKVARFTRAPCQQTRDDIEPSIIVLAPPGTLREGFARARRWINSGISVRLVGDGASLQRVWPPWTSTTPGLLVTELGAYVTGSVAEHSEPTRAAFRRWLDATFDGVTKAEGGEVFYAAAAARLFQPTLEASIYTQGLRLRHPNANFDIADPSWPARSTLSPQELETARSRSWRWRLAANTLVALVGATVRQTVDYARGRASRSAIRSHRNNGASNPPLWVALVPDWLRLSRQVLDAIALPTIESGGELGVFISSNLRRGMRSEDRGRHIGNDLWPGLGTLRKFLDRCPVEQLVSPESFRSFAGHLLTSAVASARVDSGCRVHR